MPNPAEPLSAIAAYYRGRRLAREAASRQPVQAPVPPPPYTRPAEPEWERLAEEIIAARAGQPEPPAEDARLLEGLDPIVFVAERRVRAVNWL